MMAPLIFAILLWATSVLAAGSDDSASEAFYWSIPNQNALTSAVQQCTQLTFSLYSGTMSLDDLTAPFTLYSYPKNGLPVQSGLSGSGSKLYGTVPFGSGAEVTLGIFDQKGNGGGWVGVYTVALSSDSSCIPGNSNTDVSIKLNSSSVDVCDTLGISVSGGTAPYILNILPFGTVSNDLNTTIPAGDKGFNWVVNTTTPNTMMIGVRDSTGAFAGSPATVDITGSNQTCYTTSSASTSSPSSGKSNTSALIGGIIGGVAGAILLILLIWLYIRLRRRRQLREQDAAAGVGRKPAKRLNKEKLAADGAAGAGGITAAKGKGRRAGVPEPEPDVEKAAPAAPITPFTAGLPNDDQSTAPGTPARTDRKSLAGIAGSSTAGGSKPGTRPSTAEGSTVEAGRGGFANLRVANPDAEGGPSSALPQGSKAGERPATPPQRRVVQHEDAPEGELPPEELPPAYTSIKPRKRPDGGGSS